MSSLIRLKLPIIDYKSLLKALDNCGFTYQIQKQPFRIILNNNSISFNKTKFGFTAEFSFNQRNNIDNIYNEYERIYTEKMKKIQDEKNALQYLIEQERKKMQELQNLKSKLYDNSNTKEINKINVLKNDLDEIKKKRNEIEIIYNEQLNLEKEKSIIRENMINNISEKAKSKGYIVKKIQQHENKVQLVLIRQIR
ncbi:MAG: hypothetical protein ACTSVK_09795 [Promethearchaeota archaeon]